MRRLGKSLEALARKSRPYVLPSYRRAFSRLLARGMSQRREGEPIVCCDFSSQAIDAVGGRYCFGLVRDLIAAGFFPVFTARRATLSTFGSHSLKSLLLGERFGVVRSIDDIAEPFYLITDDAAAESEHAEKIVLVDYEWRVCQGSGEIAFPFFVHPWVSSLSAPKGKEPLPSRLFFAGNTEAGKYDKDVIRDLYRMLSRREMLKVAIESIPSHQIFRPIDAEAWLNSNEFHDFVFCETQHCKIPPQRWLEALAKADFFLACPGVGMPLCHNLIEAMAAGSVPILQYGNYLTPPLSDRVNCISFKDAHGLKAAIQEIFEMSDCEIATMRANVRTHYDVHFAPGRFAQRLFSGSDKKRILLLNDYRVPR
jgi:hypothetical protein